jgi:hypothetical protein
MNARSNGRPPVGSNGYGRAKYSSLDVLNKATSPSIGTVMANPGSIPTARQPASRRLLPDATPISR